MTEDGSAHEARPAHEVGSEHEIRSVRETTCCVVGAGPAGAMLALLLARQGIPVVLLEAHGDFDRDFRGDSVHPSILEVLDEVGLADRLLAEVPHRKLRQATIPTRPPTTVSFEELPTRFPYMTFMPQARFLEFLTGEASRLPAFTLELRANVRALLTDGEAVRGVRYRGPDGWHEIHAPLTVGADGRFSQVRRLSGLTARTYGSSIDVLWFRLPREPDDPEGVVGQAGEGHLLLMIDRGETWQLGAIIPKDSFPALREAGLDTLRGQVRSLAPWLEERVDALADWKQVSLLRVQADHVRRWWKPGLLLIGDAAHVMSPVGGAGINYAVADAVATGNLLAEPLAEGRLTTADLARVQRRRSLPTRVFQAAVAQAQDRGLLRALKPGARLPNPKLIQAIFSIPLLGDLPLRVVAFGIRPEHVHPKR